MIQINKFVSTRTVKSPACPYCETGNLFSGCLLHAVPWALRGGRLELLSWARECIGLNIISMAPHAQGNEHDV